MADLARKARAFPNKHHFSSMLLQRCLSSIFNIDMFQHIKQADQCASAMWLDVLVH